jgi:GNAT superfamily N-acetyltransferase
MTLQFIVREATADDANSIAQVHVDAWRSTYQSLITDDILDSLSYEQRSSFWLAKISELETPGFILIAEDPQYGLIGFASGGRNRDEPDSFQGELYAIYLRDHYQRRGVGRSLLSRAANCLRDQGLTSMIVWVLEENPFRAFYEHLGGDRVAHRTITIGDAELSEVAYGWKDLSQFSA